MARRPAENHQRVWRDPDFRMTLDRIPKQIPGHEDVRGLRE